MEENTPGYLFTVSRLDGPKRLDLLVRVSTGEGEPELRVLAWPWKPS